MAGGSARLDPYTSFTTNERCCSCIPDVHVVCESVMMPMPMIIYMQEIEP